MHTLLLISRVLSLFIVVVVYLHTKAATQRTLNTLAEDLMLKRLIFQPFNAKLNQFLLTIKLSENFHDSKPKFF